MGKNLFVAEGYSLIDEERKEGGKKNRSKWNLNTLLAERSTKERNMRAKTKSGSQDGLKSAVHSILCVSVDGEIRLKPTAKHCLISIVSSSFPSLLIISQRAQLCFHLVQPMYI